MTQVVRLVNIVCIIFLSNISHVFAHEGGFGNEVMWAACEAKKIDDQCSFQSLDHDIFRGTCQSMSNSLVCVRNQPIEHTAFVTHIHEPEPAPALVIINNNNIWWAWLAGGIALILLSFLVFKRRIKSSISKKET